MVLWVFASRPSCSTFPEKLMKSSNMLGESKSIQPLMKHRSKRTSKMVVVLENCGTIGNCDC